MVCRFPDGYDAPETLALLQLAWRLGSPAIAAHCASQIFQKAAGSIISPADVDLQSWRLTAQHLQRWAESSPISQDALDEDLVPLADLTDKDVKVLLEAEEMLYDEVQRASAVVCHTFGGFVFLQAAASDQDSQLQRNLMEIISAMAYQASGASNVRGILNRNTQDQLPGKRTDDFDMIWALTGFKLQTMHRMPRLGPKRTSASFREQKQPVINKQATKCDQQQPRHRQLRGVLECTSAGWIFAWIQVSNLLLGVQCQ